MEGLLILRYKNEASSNFWKRIQVVRQRGSHVRLEKKYDGRRIKLTVPMHSQLKKGTLSRIIKDSKISEEEFSEFL